MEFLEHLKALGCFLLQHETLTAGVLALLAAILGVRALHQGQQQIDKHRQDDIKRQAQARLISLIPKSAHIRALARQHASAIKVLAVPHHDGSSRVVPQESQDRLHLPLLADGEDWLALTTTTDEMLKMAKSLEKDIRFHNYAVAKTTSYASDDVVKEYTGRLSRISTAAQTLETALETETG